MLAPKSAKLFPNFSVRRKRLKVSAQKQSLLPHRQAREVQLLFFAEAQASIALNPFPFQLLPSSFIVRAQPIPFL
jgi:hypothetical protein